MTGATLQLELLGEGAREIALPLSGTLVIGSSAEHADLVLGGQGVDPAHCTITPNTGGGWTLEDLGSPYGTLINGSRVSSHPLAAGDTIVIGSRRIRVVATATAASDREPKSAMGEARRPTKSIAGHRIERRLGRGSMGQVYLAIQESLNRPVALKVLAPGLAADREFVASFQAEARAAAALSHPNVVVVYDVGEAAGRHYLSMEFMAGGSLEERLRSGPLPWREVLDVLHDAAAGLMYAEERSIVHRDIKPANLMLSASGAIKIADLGLATNPGDQIDPDGERKIRGTPHFISPEQARGDRVDHRADLYSLGATAYRLLSGETPFSGANTRAILRAHLTETPRSLRTLVPGIPDSLDRLVLRLLAKDPAERPPTARALLEEVDRQRLGADRMAEAASTTGSGPTRFSLPLLLAGGVLAIGVALVAFLILGDDEPVGEDRDVAAALDPIDAQAAVAAPGSTGDALGDTEFFQPPATGNPFDDVERDLEILDLEAQIAYRDIPREAGTETRIGALQELVESYDGTNTASKARDEITTLETRVREERLEAARTAQRVVEATASLREFVNWPPSAGALPRPGDAMRKLEAFPPPPGLGSRATLAAEKARLGDEIIAVSTAALAAESERLDRFTESGDFTSARAVLADLLARYDLPAVEPGFAPTGYGELRARMRALSKRAAELDQAEREWSVVADREDQRAVAVSLGTKSPTLADLQSLRFDALVRRLTELESNLRGTLRRSFVAELRAEIELAARAPEILIRAFDAGQASDRWRRRSFRDPRRSSGTERAVLVGSEGIRIEAGGDAWVPWSAFGESSTAVHQLFRSRLARDYVPDELRAIVALLHLTAVAEAAVAARTEMEGAARVPASLTPPFDVVAAWLADDAAGVLAPHTERLIRERDAARILERALGATRSARWSGAIDGIETLLGEYDDSLLVLLLSDGSIPAAETGATGVAAEAGGTAADEGDAGD